MALVPTQKGHLTEAAYSTAQRVLPNYSRFSQHKALALSDNGRDGYSEAAPSALIAEENASKFCQYYAGGPDDPCHIVMVDDQKFGIW
jgi:hypothetical protein